MEEAPLAMESEEDVWYPLAGQVELLRNIDDEMPIAVYFGMK